MTADSKHLAGRRIRVVAPARWVPLDVVEQFSARARSWGAEVQIDPLCIERDGQLAGDDSRRAAALDAALADADVDLVWAARGGYGSLRLLKHLNKSSRSVPTIIAGYSDVTALQQRYWGSSITSVHCAMPNDLARPEKSQNLEAAARFLGALLDAGRAPQRRFALEPVLPGTVEAPLAPVNLCVLTRLLGTPFEPAWEGVILAVEDVEEYLYSIDRMFWHLAASRLSPRIKAIVVGEFAGTQDNDTPWGRTVPEIAAAHFPSIPIASGLPMGHGAVNEPFLVGEPSRLAVEKTKATLELPGAATA
jgi:muramoyltetrapeptide carboxypeptidase